MDLFAPYFVHGEVGLVVDLVERPFRSARILVTTAGKIAFEPGRRDRCVEDRRRKALAIIVALLIKAKICLVLFDGDEGVKEVRQSRRLLIRC